MSRLAQGFGAGSRCKRGPRVCVGIVAEAVDRGSWRWPRWALVFPSRHAGCALRALEFVFSCVFL